MGNTILPMKNNSGHKIFNLKWIIGSKHVQSNTNQTAFLLSSQTGERSAWKKEGLLWEGFQMMNVDLNVQGWKGQES